MFWRRDALRWHRRHPLPRQPITSAASSLHRRLPQRGRAMTDAMHRPLQLHARVLRLRRRSQVRNRHERQCQLVKTGEWIGDGGPGFAVSFSWVCCPTPPCNILRDPPGRLGRAMHPNSVATLTPISGVSLPDGPALSGAWSREVWAGHRVEKEFLIPCPPVFDINTTPNPPSTSTSSASRGIRRLSVHRRHHPRCLHRAVSFHRSRHSVALRRRPNLSRRGLVSS